MVGKATIVFRLPLVAAKKKVYLFRAPHFGLPCVLRSFASKSVSACVVVIAAQQPESNWCHSSVCSINSLCVWSTARRCVQWFWICFAIIMFSPLSCLFPAAQGGQARFKSCWCEIFRIQVLANHVISACALELMVIRFPSNLIASVYLPTQSF